MFYLVGTPIGNLGDITYRAIETLQSVDLILCEDTRTSSVLLNRYEIKKPLKSFHAFNESKMESYVLDELESGKSIALISDAGMPTLCDPGANLVKALQERELEYTVIPGPSAVSLAAAHLGLETFQFLGFAPKKGLDAFLKTALNHDGMSLFFDTPHHIQKTLEALDPETPVYILRELTKKFEEVLCQSAEAWIKRMPLKGEIVVALQGKQRSPFDPEEVMELLAKELPRSKAAKLAAKLTGTSRKELYSESRE